MASIDALEQFFHSSHHDLLLEAPCSHSAFGSTSSTAPSSYEALQCSIMASSPISHTPHMSSHIVEMDHILHSPSTSSKMISSLQQEDSCMLLSDLGTVPAASNFSDPMDIMVCDIWSLVGEPPPSQLDATHKPNYVTHTKNEIPYQEDLHLPPPSSPPMDTTHIALSTHYATGYDTRSSPACLMYSTCKAFAKKPSEFVTKPFTLSSSSSSEREEVEQRSIHLKPVCNTRGLEENAEKVDHIVPQISKNLFSERRRRKTYNAKLYSLRALVPKISKMDKASIVSDAIEHVQDLHEQVALRQQEISSLQSRLDTGGPRTERPRRVSPNSKGYPKLKVLKMDIVKMQEGTYQLRIECAKGKWAVVRLTKALEALRFDILSATLTSIGDRFLNTLVLQAEMLESQELRETILEILPKFGLIFMSK